MHRTRRTAVIGAALATTALTFSSIGVAAQEPGVPDVPTGYAELDQALAGEFTGTTVTMQTQWTAGEGDNFAENIQPFMDATGIKVKVAEVPSGQHETLVNVSLQRWCRVRYPAARAARDHQPVRRRRPHRRARPPSWT